MRTDLGDKAFTDVIKSCVETLERDALRISTPDSIENREDFIHQLKGVAGNYRLMRLWNVLEGYKSGMSTFDENQLVGILEESIAVLKKAAAIVLP